MARFEFSERALDTLALQESLTDRACGGYASFEGYVNARVMVEALYRCSTDLTPGRLHTVMTNLRWRYAGLDLDFTQDGITGSRFVELVQLNEQGKYLR